jgi:brachyury protein
MGQEDSNLWLSIKELTIEVTMTKNGRRVLPVLKVNVSDLDRTVMYSFLLGFVVANNHHKKCKDGQYAPEGKFDLQAPKCVFV